MSAMTTPDREPPQPSPAAVRLRRPTWRDPRLLIGVLLVAASVALGSWAVSSADRTAPVYAARATLPPGTALGPELVVVAHVRLTGLTAEYLPGDRPLPADLVVTRTVGDGELIPVAALGAADDLGLRPVVISSREPLPDAVQAGSVVDLWVAPPGPSGEPEVPRPLVTGLTVVEITRPSGSLSLGAVTAVQVLVPEEELPGVLAASADQDTVLTVVPLPGNAAAGGS